jgi:hypothetical protein
MPDTLTKPRPWRSHNHLATVLEADDGGAIWIQPLRAGDIYFDVAKSNHLPANLPHSDYNGSHVLNIGRDVEIRASGNARLVSGAWTVETRYFYANQYPSGRELTAKQSERARALIAEIIGAWAATHAGDIAQADDIDRNNAAHTLEGNIARHEQAIAVLRENLTACEGGEPFTQYPDLPTNRR